MWWWDSSGAWSITAYINDTSDNSVTNDTQTFYIGLTTGFDIGPSVLNWSGLSPGTTNQTASNDPILMNNTGNKQINAPDIQINATNLRGETTSTEALWADNFTVSWANGSTPPVECGSAVSTNMSAGVYTNITTANLTVGNYTLNNGTAQEELYFCIRIIGSELSNQQYSTANETAWTIRILLVVLTVKGVSKLKKKKKKRKQKTKQKIIENLTLPSTIFSNKKLGCLEAITKYLKENLGMTYHGIAEILNRNDRTIWTAYKKAVEKEPERIRQEKMLISLPIIKLEKTLIVLPVSIFKNRKLTTLEAIIVYLKQKEIEYTKIADLLNRDQRNIWTIYSNAERKLKRQS